LISTVLDSGTGRLSLTTQFGYDAQGDVNLTIDPNSNATTSTYELDRLKQEDDHHNGDQNVTLNAASLTKYDELRRDIEEDVGLTFSGATTWQLNKTIVYSPNLL